MAFPVLPSLGLGALSSVAGMVYNSVQTDKARKWSAEMQDKSFTQQRDLMDYQDSLNSPSRQVARLKDAGLNPASAEPMSVGLGSTPSFPGTEVPQFINPIDSAQAVANIGLSQSQADLMRSQTRKNDAEADTIDSTRFWQVALMRGNLSSLGLDIRLKTDLMPFQTKKFASEIANIDASTSKLLTDASVGLRQMSLNESLASLEKSKFDFSKWLERSKLSQVDKSLSIQWYNAFTSRLVGNSQVDLNNSSSFLNSQSYWIRHREDILLEDSFENRRSANRKSSTYVDSTQRLQNVLGTIQQATSAIGSVLTPIAIGKGLVGARSHSLYPSSSSISY